MNRRSVTEETDRGRAARTEVPRSAHAEWAPTPGRLDPVGLLLEQDATRARDLVPVRHGRMAASAFAFFRGAAAIMAADLASMPSTGLTTQLCGDAHLSNLGVYGSPERRMVFDLNDFDETLPGPFEWDVKRLATSFVIAARDREMPDKDARSAVGTCVASYREAMAEFAGMGLLDTWYSHVDMADLELQLAASAGKAALRATKKRVEKARAHTSNRVVTKLAEKVDGKLRIRDDPPIVVPLSTIPGLDPERIAADVRTFFAAYIATLPAAHQHLIDQYEIVDIAQKVVGVGSVGTRAFIVLLLGRTDDDPLVLQFKEAGASVLERWLGPSAATTGGERVVEGQRLTQAVSDIFLGWATSPTDGRSYYWRQLHDMKGSADLETISARGLTAYARLCGWSLARAHARAGSPVAMSAYLGKSTAFDEAITAFAFAYADQNDQDFAAHAQAIATGRVEARTGV